MGSCRRVDWGDHADSFVLVLVLLYLAAGYYLVLVLDFVSVVGCDKVGVVFGFWGWCWWVSIKSVDDIHAPPAQSS